MKRIFSISMVVLICFFSNLDSAVFPDESSAETKIELPARFVGTQEVIYQGGSFYREVVVIIDPDLTGEIRTAKVVFSGGKMYFYMLYVVEKYKISGDLIEAISKPQTKNQRFLKIVDNSTLSIEGWETKDMGGVKFLPVLLRRVE